MARIRKKKTQSPPKKQKLAKQQCGLMKLEQEQYLLVFKFCGKADILSFALTCSQASTIVQNAQPHVLSFYQQLKSRTVTTQVRSRRNRIIPKRTEVIVIDDESSSANVIAPTTAPETQTKTSKVIEVDKEPAVSQRTLAPRAAKIKSEERTKALFNKKRSATPVGEVRSEPEPVRPASSARAPKDFRQKESIEHRLHHLLQDYPKEDCTILKELLQNAEDADATVFKVVLDLRKKTNELDGLNLQSRKYIEHLLQGEPSLFVYNNKPFSSDDLSNISCLSKPSKVNKPNKIGRFGVGFNSVFHFTDNPMFVTQKNMAVFAPLDRDELDGGKLFEICDDDDDYKLFNVIEGARWDEQSGLDGVVFRFPLRKNKSSISVSEWTQEAAISYLIEFKEKIVEYVLFLKNVREIVVDILRDDKVESLLNLKIVPDSSMQQAHQIIEKTLLGQLPVKEQNLFGIVTFEGTAGMDNINQMVLYSISISEDSTLVRLCEESNRRRMNSGGAIRSRLFPVVSIAVPIAKSMSSYVIDEAHAFKGRYYCHLPLMDFTNLPVHINSYFEVGTSRRNLDNATKTCWNKHIVEIVASHALVNLIEKLIHYLAALPFITKEQVLQILSIADQKNKTLLVTTEAEWQKTVLTKLSARKAFITSSKSLRYMNDCYFVSARVLENRVAEQTENMILPLFSVAEKDGYPLVVVPETTIYHFPSNTHASAETLLKFYKNLYQQKSDSDIHLSLRDSAPVFEMLLRVFSTKIEQLKHVGFPFKLWDAEGKFAVKWINYENPNITVYHHADTTVETAFANFVKSIGAHKAQQIGFPDISVKNSSLVSTFKEVFQHITPSQISKLLKSISAPNNTFVVNTNVRGAHVQAFWKLVKDLKGKTKDLDLNAKHFSNLCLIPTQTGYVSLEHSDKVLRTSSPEWADVLKFFDIPVFSPLEGTEDYIEEISTRCTTASILSALAALFEVKPEQITNKLKALKRNLSKLTSMMNTLVIGFLESSAEQQVKAIGLFSTLPLFKAQSEDEESDELVSLTEKGDIWMLDDSDDPKDSPFPTDVELCSLEDIGTLVIPLYSLDDSNYSHRDVVSAIQRSTKKDCIKIRNIASVSEAIIAEGVLQKWVDCNHKTYWQKFLKFLQDNSHISSAVKLAPAKIIKIGKKLFSVEQVYHWKVDNAQEAQTLIQYVNSHKLLPLLPLKEYQSFVELLGRHGLKQSISGKELFTIASHMTTRQFVGGYKYIVQYMVSMIKNQLQTLTQGTQYDNQCLGTEFNQIFDLPIFECYAYTIEQFMSKLMKQENCAIQEEKPDSNYGSFSSLELHKNFKTHGTSVYFFSEEIPERDLITLSYHRALRCGIQGDKHSPCCAIPAVLQHLTAISNFTNAAKEISETIITDVTKSIYETLSMYSKHLKKPGDYVPILISCRKKLQFCSISAVFLNAEEIEGYIYQPLLQDFAPLYTALGVCKSPNSAFLNGILSTMSKSKNQNPLLASKAIAIITTFKFDDPVKYLVTAHDEVLPIEQCLLDDTPHYEQYLYNPALKIPIIHRGLRKVARQMRTVRRVSSSLSKRMPTFTEPHPNGMDLKLLIPYVRQLLYLEYKNINPLAIPVLEQRMNDILQRKVSSVQELKCEVYVGNIKITAEGAHCIYESSNKEEPLIICPSAEMHICEEQIVAEYILQNMQIVNNHTQFCMLSLLKSNKAQTHNYTEIMAAFDIPDYTDCE